MRYRRLGNSGLQVSELSLGSWLTFGKQITDTVAEKLMVTAYDNGVNFFDNAEIYARGESEQENCLRRWDCIGSTLLKPVTKLWKDFRWNTWTCTSATARTRTRPSRRRCGPCTS